LHCTLKSDRILLPESILAKRRGYGTLVSYNVPPYGRAGLYLELANLRELVDEYRSESSRGTVDETLCEAAYDLAFKCGMINDVPLSRDSSEPDLSRCLEDGSFQAWMLALSDYLNTLQDRLFSSGLR
jgi:magnesium chelatase subunit H